MIGYGFVEFDSYNIAKEILQDLNGKFIPNFNKNLRLNWASYNTGKNLPPGCLTPGDASVFYKINFIRFMLEN